MTAASFRRQGAAALVVPLVLVLLLGCGRREGATVLEGQLRAGDADYWLVGATLVAIGGAEIGGEPSKIGSQVRAEGRLQPDGVFAATRLTVGAARPVPASLTAATASGPVEALDPASGRWQVGGRAVQLAPGVSVPATLKMGDRVTVAGYALPDGLLLASEVAADRPTPTTAPPTATATTRPPSVAPVPAATEKPPQTKPTKKPNNRDDDDDDD